MTGRAVLAATLLGLAVLLLAWPRTSGGLRLGRLQPARAPVEARWRRPARRLTAALGRGAARDRERARAVETCAALGGELRAGRPPAAALAAAAPLAVGPTADVLAAAASAAALGGDVAGVLARGAPLTSSPALLRGLGACWALCSGTGSGLAAAVERLERAERDAQDRRRAVQAELSGPRATARMLAGLPVLGVLLAAGLGARPVQLLLTTALGLTCLVAGVALDVAGVLWTRRLVTRAAAT